MSTWGLLYAVEKKNLSGKFYKKFVIDGSTTWVCVCECVRERICVTWDASH